MVARGVSFHPRGEDCSINPARVCKGEGWEEKRSVRGASADRPQFILTVILEMNRSFSLRAA